MQEEEGLTASGVLSKEKIVIVSDGVRHGFRGSAASDESGLH